MNKKRIQNPPQGGAYALYLNIRKSMTLQVGSLKEGVFPSGRYVYVGSARKSIAGRIARHRRLAETKTGNIHWHIDYLLTNPGIDLIGEKIHAGRMECDVAREIASMPDASVPVRGFGSSDCRCGCRAHLFRIGDKLD